MKPIHFAVVVVLIMALVGSLIVFAVAGERADNAALELLHQEAISGNPAAVLAYCDAVILESGNDSGGKFADCVERAQLEAFATASGRWAGGE